MGPICGNAELRVGLGPIYRRSRNSMKSHDFPVGDIGLVSRFQPSSTRRIRRSRRETALGCVQPVRGAGYEPLCDRLHARVRVEGTGVGSRSISRGAHWVGRSRDRYEAPSVDSRNQSVGRSSEVMADDGATVAGGSDLHITVLGRHAVGFLNVRDGGIYVDGTFGAGGYTRAILAAADCKVIGIDRDQTAIALGADLVEQARGRLTLIEDRFSNLDAIARDAGHE